MLSFDTLLDCVDIEKVKALKENKVFLLTGFNGDRLVVKADAVNKAQLKSANWTMNAIDPRARAKALKDTELAELRLFADMGVFQLEMLEKSGINQVNDKHPMRELQGSPGWDGTGDFTWFKMEAHTLIDMEKAYTLAHRPGKNKPADLSHITEFCTTLKGPGGLERLGEIIAVDLFNGYKDRFYPGGGFLFRQWKAIVNLGNVMLIMDSNNNLVPSGLDAVNRESPTWKQQVTADWSGHLLSDIARRRTFAGDVIDDIEHIFAPIPPTARRFKTPEPALGKHSKSVQRLIDGMRNGVKKIIQKVRDKGDKLGSLSKVDAGLFERYRLVSALRTDI